ncbi:MAG: hypothetical protein VX105_05700, partial [Cyanobacteriota bacterium]|nr:hypothetical protein [Cyanobacteriota bacterium]
MDPVGTAPEQAPPEEAEASALSDDGSAEKVSPEVVPSDPHQPEAVLADPVQPDLVERVLHAAGCACAACGGVPSSQSQQGSGGEVLAAASLGTLDQLADYLETQFWTDSDTTNRNFNLSESGTHAKSGVLTYNSSGNTFDANGLTTGRASMVDEAFKIFEATLGIDFQETSAFDADLDFSDNNSGAFAVADFS